ncbi:uncharacterized protein LOC124637657 [Helicoverpa zea]|uniref:uncharacterized protein LOC124637657 n=1 Tax=Helicoverpa zea TaxID=7113 RepID=UPI001F5AEBA9|nr:uncharacterized protein LOC124637657 [Helicoverpa zea]
MCVGKLPDSFYVKIQKIPYSFVVMNLDDPDDYFIEDTVPYHANFIIISCQDYEELEELRQKLVASPYFHPLANILTYYHRKEDKETMAKLFFSAWYYKAINSILVQYSDEEETLLVSDFTPYVNEDYKIQPENKFGCWTARNLGMPVVGFDTGYVCVEKCHNVSIHTRLRANNLGTCIGFNTNVVSYNDFKHLRNLNLFEDRTKDLHGFVFRAYAVQVKPFFLIKNHGNGTYTLYARDGMIWNTMAELFNFGIDLSPSVDVMMKPFNFEISIDQIFAFARRKGDLCLFPIYQFDVIVVGLDFTYPFKDSGICILSARAGFETSLFRIKTLRANISTIILFLACFACTWATFTVYKAAEKRHLSFDQIGKDFMNTCRQILMINLYKPPTHHFFRIFLAIALWCFFVINFTSQATIISFFTAVKRGKEVDTFDDVVAKGYPLEAMASPDLILPDTEEKFRIINSRLVNEVDIYGCVDRLKTDPRRFCLMDCSVGRYIKRNRLNHRGEQYLHIAEQDRIHSHYLAMVFSEHSPMTERFSRYMMILCEAGLIRKWEQYRYTDIKDDVTTKPLAFDDLSGIFQVFCFMVGNTLIIFFLELVASRIKTCCQNIKIPNGLPKRNTE